MQRLIWMLGLLAACGDDGSRHIVDGQGSGSAGPTTYGQVQFALTSGEATVFATAQFAHDVTSGSLPAECTTMALGACSVTVCPTAPTTTTNGTYDDAGTITFAGGTPPQTITLPEMANHTYQDNADIGATSYDGATITMTGTGGLVPAFNEMIALSVPPQIDMPVGTSTVPRSSDLTIAWSKGSRNTFVQVELFHPPYSFVGCVSNANGDAGSLTIPSALLQVMPAGPTMAYGYGYASETKMIGDYATTFYAGGTLTGPSAAPYAAELDLQ